MAERIVISAIEKLLVFVNQEVNKFKSIPREIRAINNELQSIRAVIKDAERKSATDEGVNEWLRQVRDIAYHIEDLIDDYLLLVDQQQPSHCCGIKSIVGRVLQLKWKNELASSIKRIKQDINEISMRRNRYKFISVSEQQQQEDCDGEDPRIFHPFLDESELVGIEENKTKIVRLLLKGNSKPYAVSIVGSGGIGKTTLIRNVYEDNKVRKHFKAYAWITVSQSYRRLYLLRSLFNQLVEAQGLNPELMGIDEIIGLLS